MSTNSPESLTGSGSAPRFARQEMPSAYNANADHPHTSSSELQSRITTASALLSLEAALAGGGVPMNLSAASSEASGLMYRVKKAQAENK